MTNSINQQTPEETGATTNSTDVINPVPTITSTSKEEDIKVEIPYIITAKDLALIKAPVNRYLLEPFLPTSGTALVAGQPDTGKSQFARQLAIQITQGNNLFLGFSLHPIHNRALYVATEDDMYNCQFLMMQQHKGLECEPSENLNFIFADSLDSVGLLKKLNEFLKSNPTDLVIIDGFGDIFQGSDMNSNTQMRAAVNQFDRLAKEHNCLVLFVHHINKAAYNKKATQQGIQGGSGLAQKVRLAWQLSSREDGLKELAVTKGNYCPTEFKKNPITLSFDQDTFTFSRGNGDPTQLDLFKEPSLTKNETRFSKAMPLIQKELEASRGLPYSKLIELIGAKSLIPESSVKKLMSSPIGKKYIRHDIEAGTYFWNDPSIQDEIGKDTRDELPIEGSKTPQGLLDGNS